MESSSRHCSSDWCDFDPSMDAAELPSSIVQATDQFPGIQYSSRPCYPPVEGLSSGDGSNSYRSGGAPACAASKSHSLAEKRRRDRINAQLATLRKLVPKSDKMDKAALLGSVIAQVKDLKRKASEISKTSLVPTETDDVSIDLEVPKHCNSISAGNNNSSSGGVFIRASVCCDDRPELLGELVRVIQGMRLTTVRADMISVGGRMRSILVLCSEDGEDGFCVSSLKQSLRVVLSRIAASASMATSNCRSIRSKRQRFFLP